MTEEEYKEMCLVMDGIREAEEERDEEIERHNTEFINSLCLSEYERQQLLSEDLLGDVIVTSKIVPCDTPTGMKEEPYRDAAVDFLPIFVRQSVGYLGDDFSGSVWFHFKGQCYKFDYEC